MSIPEDISDYIFAHSHEDKTIRERLERLEHAVHHIFHILHSLTHPNHIFSFTITQTQTGATNMALTPIAPGFSPVFTATPVPAGTFPAPGNLPVMTSSDTTNAPVTIDATGLVGTVNIPATAVVGTSFTLSENYVNADGTTATGSATFTIVAAPPSDITSFVIQQTA